VARRPATIILSVVFSLLAFAAWLMVLFLVFDESNTQPMLTTWQTCIALVATMTVWGSWHRRKWAPSAAAAYGLEAAGMLVALPSILPLPAKARPGMWAGAAAVLVFALLCALYFRFDSRRQSGTPLDQASS
jgi:hypothetical protein